MKKIILIICFVLVYSSAFSQYLVDGLKWNNTSGGTDDWGVNIYRNFTYKVDGDTAINGVAYKMIKMNYPDIDNQWSSAFYLREDNRKWYLIGRNGNLNAEEELLYDFSLMTGDSINLPWANNNSVKVVADGDTILENGESRKYLILGNNDVPTNYNDIWIEGLGSAICHIDLPCFYLIIIDACATSLCASFNEELLFTSYPNLHCYDMGGNFITSLTNIFCKDNSITLYPNPARQEVNISSENIINSIEVFNSLGKKVYLTNVKAKEKTLDINTLSKGVYIIEINTDKGYVRKKLIKD